MSSAQIQAAGEARRNELLVRVRRPFDMAGQVAVAIAVIVLLDDYIDRLWQAVYFGATCIALILQYLMHRRFIGDRERRANALHWRLRLVSAYALNGLILGSIIAAVVRLPIEPMPLLALLCLIASVTSVSLTIAVQFMASAAVILLALLPGVVLLLLSNTASGHVLGTIGLVGIVMLLSFSHRLSRYFRRTTATVERLRRMLQDRTRISASAEEAQRRLESILDAAPFPIVVVRRDDGAFLYSNRQATGLFGIGDGGMTMATPRYVLDPMHRARIFSDRQDPDAELQLQTAKGDVIWATMAAVPMRYADADAALVVVNDITGRKASEQRLREAEQHLSDALAVAPDGVALFDPEQTLVICNKSYADIIGVSLSAATGMSHAEICRASMRSRPAMTKSGHPADYTGWMAERIRTFDAGAGEPHIFYDTRERRWLQIRDFRLASGGTASLITDITTLKRNERDLREANESLAARTETLETARAAAIKAHQDAEYANRAKSQFLAHMSHELRTPLNAIIGFSEIMSLQLLGASGVPQYDRYAGDILAAGRHLLAVIDDILDLSKVEAGKMKLVPEYLNWPRLAEDCATLLRPMAADRLVTLAADPAPEGTLLFADQRLAKQMLVNLLSNGVKYTPSGGQIRFGITAADNGGSIVWVSDTGVGMDESDVQKALEPFGRIDSALVSQMRGTGLGLPLVKALIELHRGRLEIASQPGKGTMVRLHFPPGPKDALAALKP